MKFRHFGAPPGLQSSLAKSHFIAIRNLYITHSNTDTLNSNSGFAIRNLGLIAKIGLSYRSIGSLIGQRAGELFAGVVG